MRYDYSCKDCGLEFEVSHGMNEKPQISCEECGSKNTTRLFSAPGIISKNSGQIYAAKERGIRESDMMSDIRQNYGVENVTPLKKGGLTRVYNEIKESGSFTKDQMQEKAEREEKKRVEKNKEWMKKARKRANEKGRIAKREKAKEAYNKRKVKA